MGSFRSTLGGIMRVWPALARERRTLANLDPAQLRDVGIDATHARREAERPFWDRPANR